MPLLLSPERIALGQYSIRPIVTPSGTQGIFLQNVSSLSITVNSRLGSVQIPPAFIATLPMDENDQITFDAVPSGTNFPAAFPQYVDVSYSFVPVAPAGTGLFIVPTTGGATPAVSVAVTPDPVNITDASGTTSTTAGSSTVALAAGSVTRYLLIENVSSTSGDNLWVNFGAAATEGQGSVLVGPGAALVFEANTVPSSSVNVVSNVASLPFTLKYA